MTYSPSDAAAACASPGLDVHAGRPPRSGGFREVLLGTLGYRVVHFRPIRPNGQSNGLRLGSALSALVRQRCVLARS